jgi:hypothetical protein
MTYQKEIDVASVQRAASAAHYINTAANGTHEAMIIGEVAPILTNATTRMDELVKFSESADYFAANGILASLGWNVINGLLWNFRQRNATAAAPEASVDAFADMINTRSGRGEQDRMSTDNGFDATERFDYTQDFCVSVYKQLFFNQKGSTVQAAAKFPPTAPHVVLHEMQVGNRDKELSEAVSEFKKEQLQKSPARLELEAATAVTKKVFDAHQTKMHKLEESYVLNEIKRVLPEELTDANWAMFPLIAQYKWTFSVYRQVIKAYGYESSLDAPDEHKLQQLADLAGEMRLELEGAARTKEIRLAFTNGQLTDKHELMTSVKEVIATAARVPAPVTLTEAIGEILDTSNTVPTGVVEDKVAKLLARRAAAKAAKASQ